MTTAPQPLTLVTGGTGKTGRRVAERLAARGVPVRIGSRSGAPRFDWEDPSTWAAALAGAGAVYVAFQPDLAVPGATDAVAALARLAAERGVDRLVLLSGRGEEEAQRAELAVRAVVPRATVVRCSFFAQNFSDGDWGDDVRAGTVALPVAGVVEPFVDADDVADVAVAALTDPATHAGRLYELTGPRLLTFAEAVAEIARASGRDVRFASVGLDEYTAALARHDVPAEVVGLLAYLFGEVMDGRNARVADGVREALGRPARDFAAFARDAAAAGAWRAPAAVPAG
jgi:uncharacterized protein YbjT (DUF2867 family)